MKYPTIDMGPFINVREEIDSHEFEYLIMNPASDPLEIEAFDTYCTGHFEHFFFSPLRHAIENKEISIGQLNKIKSVDYISADEMDIVGYDFTEKTDTSVYIDAQVQVEIVVGESVNGYIDIEEIVRVFKISAVYDLADGSFTTIRDSLELYDKNNRRKGQPLTEHLVPRFSTYSLEREVKNFLTKYARENLKTPMKFDAYQLVKNMKLHLVTARLTLNGSILGKIIFDDNVVSVYDENGKEQKINVEAGTIMIDPEVAEAHGHGIESTIIHECFHFYKHRLFYLLQKLYNDELRCFSCSVVKDEDDNYEPVQWMEWQASFSTPRIQMPACPTRQKIEQLIAQYSSKVIYRTKMFERIIGVMAEFYGVSKASARRRVIELGYPEAQGVCNYVNGAYVPTFSFKPGALHKGQTFTVSLDALLDVYETSPEFRKVMDSGRFMYLDGVCCLNTPKYIYKRNGYHLTTYARDHAEECCLIFSIKSGRNRYGYQEGTLHSEAGVYVSRLEFNTKFNELVMSFADNFRDDLKSVRDMMVKYCTAHGVLWSELSFAETIIALMLWRNMSYENTALKAGIPKRSMERLRSTTNPKQPTIQEVIGICIALSLPETLRDDLFTKANTGFTNSVEHQVYRMLLGQLIKGSIQDFNDALHYLYNMPPFFPIMDEVADDRRRYQRMLEA